MKLVAALGMVFGGAMIIGCGSTAPPAKGPPDIMAILESELSHAIGSTTLTSASTPAATPARAPSSSDLGIETEAAAPLKTWGAQPPGADSDEASDLANNPYGGARDIYDPR